jgi:hypothetical protein
MIVGAGGALVNRRAADGASVVGQDEVPPLSERPCKPDQSRWLSPSRPM